ncbi:hypothetical protein PIB30_061932 [Stylosanthes scabra]|uniref:Secreted protein n=1 Tax=Stylosanthes scabra TaxID=79078 RepID=A0ABU6SL36_9FABA|nr:hypothetical protein [Stylosanthes scabra]
MLPSRHLHRSLHHLCRHSFSLRRRLFFYFFSSFLLPPQSYCVTAASSASTSDSGEASIAAVRQSTTLICASASCATPIYSNSTKATSFSSLCDPDRRHHFFGRLCPISSSGRRLFFVR